MTWKIVRFGLCLVGFGLLAGASCPTELPEPDNYILVLRGNVVVNDQTVEVASNEDVTFVAKVGGDLIGELTTWRVEEGQIRGEFPGSQYSNTWTNTTGVPITYVITVIGHNSHDVPATFKVKVMPVPFDGGDGGAIPDLVWVDGGLVIVGGVWKDGVIEVVLGQTLRLDATNFVRGGQNPLTVYWVSSGGAQLFVGPVWSLLCDRVGRTEILLRVVDGRGKNLEKVIVIVVVDPGGGGTVLSPSVDLKINGSDGPITVAATADGNAYVTASWGSGNALRVDMSGAPDWQGERALQEDAEEVTLPAGTWTLKATAKNAQGWEVPDTVTVAVTPYQNPNPPPVGDLVVTITAPADWQSFALNQNVDFTVSIAGGTPPFVVHWMFYDGENIFGNTSARSWTHRKKLETKATDWVQNAVQVSDGGERVSAPAYLKFKVP